MKVLWGLAGLTAMIAGLLTWVLGFIVTNGQSLISTTLALFLGLGGWWMFNARRRRWSWILVLISLPLGFYFNYIGPHFQLPAIFAVLSLLLALTAALFGLARGASAAPAEDVITLDDGRQDDVGAG